MRLDDIGQSSNVEDRRGGGAGGGGGRRAGAPGRTLGIGGMIIVGIIALFLGVDPRTLLGGSGPAFDAPQHAGRETLGAPAPGDEVGRFVSQVLRLNEDVWNVVLPAQLGVDYVEPKLTLFRGYTVSGCGNAQSAMGPFYCPLDQKVYLDTSFFDEMRTRLGGGGDFAYAYVIAHEVGHHIQNILGILPKVQAAQRRLDQARANDLSVRIELMADCLGGVWAHHAERRFRILEEGDIEEAVRTAAAIGDDRLQQTAQGYAVPDSFTHGTAEQRARWLTTGLRTGEVNACDTLKASRL
jgi:hypothetical protein